MFDAQITDLFDDIWTVKTALKNLRWQVRGYHEDNDLSNIARLTTTFVKKEDVTNRPNLSRTCIEEDWEETEFRIAKNLLVNIFSCYENWVDQMLVLLRVESPQPKKISFLIPFRQN